MKYVFYFIVLLKFMLVFTFKEIHLSCLIFKFESFFFVSKRVICTFIIDFVADKKTF